ISICSGGTWDAENLTDELWFQLNTLTATPTKLDLALHSLLSWQLHCLSSRYASISDSNLRLTRVGCFALFHCQILDAILQCYFVVVPNLTLVPLKSNHLAAAEYQTRVE
ncbi:hypothetical protein S245_067658, partial [Arachis hypogaea]